MNDQSPLLPDRYPQKELFLCDVTDAVLKGDMASMEHPFFSLTTQKDTAVRRYENGDKWVEVIPSVRGLATVFDKDILIFATSQLMAAKKEGREVSQELVMSARDVLVFSNRHTGGHNYALLEDALERLRGTQVSTNVLTGGEREWNTFGLVERATVIRDDKSGRVKELRIKLSDYLFRQIMSNEVLALAPDYFRLRKAIERRVYEIGRKHCGAQAEWLIGLGLLQSKCGSRDSLKKFRSTMREIEEKDHLPDYHIIMEPADKVRFVNRNTMKKVEDATGKINLSSDAFHDARQVAPGWDVYFLEQKWRGWMAKRMEEGMETPRNPDAAFFGFCRKWYERNGAPV
ncbi:MAG: replication initiator protein A [Hyphomicrobiaceae bacterium]|nr:replication initiator protein A [Hyphomicrobiaceae bacterium]